MDGLGPTHPKKRRRMVCWAKFNIIYNNNNKKISKKIPKAAYLNCKIQI
jgi:hypothetical protein